MPIKENSLSAVNASAILHEVSSYGVCTEDGKKVLGIEAIRKILNEVKRCLAENGAFIYRDVACPRNRSEIKIVNYETKSWQMFLDMYIPILCDASKGLSSKIFNGYKLDEENGSKRITATVQMQREIQRHYITFRDYFRKKIFPEMGIKIINESWIEKDKGNKKHSVELSGIALKHYINRTKSESQTAGMKNLLLNMSSDEYDDFTDEIIEKGLDEKSFNFYDEWFRREGREIYTYLDTEELKQIAAENKNSSTKSGSGLVAESEKIAPRHYYQRYLDRIIKNPEFEGKQIINFIKKTYDK